MFKAYFSKKKSIGDIYYSIISKLLINQMSENRCSLAY